MAASALSLSSAYKASVFSEINTVIPYIFFTQNLSYGKVLWQSKLEKILSIRFWPASVFVLKYVLIWFIFAHKLLKQLGLIDIYMSKHKVKSYMYFVNQFLVEKPHKKCNQECKEKQSFLFNFWNIFDLLTSRTQKIAWWPPVFKPDFYIFSYNEKLRKI